MDKIRRQVNIGLNAECAFDIFVLVLNDWWPKEHIWSQGSLRGIIIDARVRGFCTETDPYGFRCDWGRITEYAHAESIGLT